MSRTACATLVTDHLIHNWQTLRQIAPTSGMWAMVKANAYGHGIRSVSQRLEPYLKPDDAFGVASIDEAMALRKVGISSDIVLIEGVFDPSELELASVKGFTVVFHSKRQIEWLQQVTLTSPIRGWLKVNTGMGRLGVPMSDAISLWQMLSDCSSLQQPVGMMSHLACADDKTHPLNAKQMLAFNIFRSLNVPLSLCASAGIVQWPSHHFDVVRPGLALYGASPISDISSRSLQLKPVMSLHTNIIALHQLDQGECVGYGGAFMCPERMPVGIVAMGYGDGYPRLATHAPVMVRGVVCRVIGRVSMDMMAIDLRPCLQHGQKAQEGDDVLLWGENACGYLPVEDVASSTNRVPYDLLTGVQHRVHFHWV